MVCTRGREGRERDDGREAHVGLLYNSAADVLLLTRRPMLALLSSASAWANLLFARTCGPFQ